MSERLSNEYGHDFSEKEKVENQPEILPNPDLSLPLADEPRPDHVPANEGGTA
jgi:hypothetical protein